MGPADYILFVDNEFVGGIEAQRLEDGQRLRTVKRQSREYTDSNINSLSENILSNLKEQKKM